jgi:hypothetical protein
MPDGPPLRSILRSYQRCKALLDLHGEYRRLMHEPFGPLNSLHALSLLPAPIKATRLLKRALG